MGYIPLKVEMCGRPMYSIRIDMRNMKILYQEHPKFRLEANFWVARIFTAKRGGFFECLTLAQQKFAPKISLFCWTNVKSRKFASFAAKVKAFQKSDHGFRVFPIPKNIFANLSIDFDFRLFQGEDMLTTYQCNTKVAKHPFCKVCGVQSFYVPRSNPDSYGNFDIVCVTAADRGKIQVQTVVFVACCTSIPIGFCQEIRQLLNK